MKSLVYFLSSSAKDLLNENLEPFLSFLNLVFKETRFLELIPYHRRIGIKLHFGEAGRNNYLKPEFVHQVVLHTGRKGLQPFLIETATLYRGMRQEAKSHFVLAQEHGFTLPKVLAPILFLDGKVGNSYYEIDGKKISQGLKRISFLINLTHFKGHFVTGFGGALKNIGMGLAAKGGKLQMHSVSIPHIEPSRCNACGLCAKYCPRGAVIFKNGRYLINSVCIGCAGCLTICPHQAIGINWDATPEELGEKIAEYAQVVLKDRLTLHFNFLFDITQNCDCFPKTEEPFMEDVGILASYDPVALDQASYDMVKPKLKSLYPHLKPERILQKAEELGIGQREYQLCPV